MIRISKNQNGYSLVELSIVLVIIGVIGFFSVKFISQIGQQTLNEKFKNDLEMADAAISGFVYANSRLPCPDVTSPPDGIEDCGSINNNQGSLPVKTLGIESSLQKQRGGQIRYASFRNNNADALLDTDLSSLKDRYEPFLPNSETSTQSNGLDFCLALRTASRSTIPLNNQVNILTRTPGVFINVAYAIADSGAIDANNDGNLFDGSNAAGLAFERPKASHLNNYDDNVKAVGFNELAGRLKCAKLLSETNGAARASFAAYDMWQVSTMYKDYRYFHVHYLEIMVEIAESKFALATAALVLSLLSTGLAVANAILTGGTSTIVGAALAAAASIDAIIAEALAVSDLDSARESLTAGIAQRTEAIATWNESATFKDTKLAIVKALDLKGLIR